MFRIGVKTENRRHSQNQQKGNPEPADDRVIEDLLDHSGLLGRGNGFNPCLAQCFADGRPGRITGKMPRPYRRSRQETALQQIAIAIDIFRHAQTASLISLTYQHQLRNPLGPAEGIKPCQQVIHGFRAQFLQPVHIQVFAAGMGGHGGIFARHFPARADRLHRCKSVMFVRDVFRPLLGRRQALADVMEQGRGAGSDRQSEGVCMRCSGSKPPDQRRQKTVARPDRAARPDGPGQ